MTRTCTPETFTDPDVWHIGIIAWPGEPVVCFNCDAEFDTCAWCGRFRAIVPGEVLCEECWVESK